MTDTTSSPTNYSKFDDAGLEIVWNALNRNNDLKLLEELYNGLAPERRSPLIPKSKLAFGFDTNVIFRLGLTRQGPNAIDYLTTLHEGPVIVPGQAVQEIWNNFLAGVEPKSKIVATKLFELEKELETIGQELGPLGEEAKDAIQTLIKSHGDWTDPTSLRNFESTVKALLDIAVVSSVPRDEFYQLALVRKETKTPPGFRDDARNFGDYYIWADFLYGIAKADLSNVDAVVFVTNDEKKDWSKNKVPHPVLVAEARQVSGKEFRLWTLEEFRSHAKAMAS